MCIWNCLCHDTQLNGVLLHPAIFHCVYLAITKATLVKLKLAIVFLLIYIIYIYFFPPNSHVYGLFALLTAGLVSAFAFKKGGGGRHRILVRLLIEGIDFVVRAKWYLSGSRHVESHLLLLIRYAVLLQTLLYVVCLPLRAQAETYSFWTVHFS